MKVIVLQHINIEDPGYIKDLMIKDGVELTTIELDEGQKIPTDLSKFDDDSHNELTFRMVFTITSKASQN